MSKHRKKLKFKDVWANQTDIGKLFGLSAIKVGNKLTEHGLKDPDTKKATEKALKEGFVKETPLKDGTYFCMWNKQKIKSLLLSDIKPISNEQIWINEALKRCKEIKRMDDEGEDKLSSLMWESLYDDIPKEYRTKVQEAIEAQS